MQFKIATVVSLVACVLAAPQMGSPIGVPPALGPWAIPSDTTIGQAGDTCGSKLALSCCNKVDQSGDSVAAASGLLAGVLQGTLSGKDGLGLFDGCSKLGLPVGKSHHESKLVSRTAPMVALLTLVQAFSVLELATFSTASASRLLPAASTPARNR